MLNQYFCQLHLKAGGDKIVKCFEDNLSDEFTAEYDRKQAIIKYN